MRILRTQVENLAIRRAFDEATETWWFSVVDLFKVLTDSPNPAVYWRVLKKRVKDEGNETVTNRNALQMMSTPETLLQAGLRGAL